MERAKLAKNRCEQDFFARAYLQGKIANKSSESDSPVEFGTGAHLLRRGVSIDGSDGVSAKHNHLDSMKCFQEDKMFDPAADIMMDEKLSSSNQNRYFNTDKPINDDEDLYSNFDFRFQNEQI
jgi:hypothetical protein